LSPHAPYSASPAVFAAARQSGRHLMVHAAEVAEEVEFLRDGRGPLRDLLEELGRLPARFRAPGCTPVAYLDRLGVLGRGTALIHAQHLAAGEAELVRARRAAFVVCPGTIEYFGRAAPDVGAWLELGIPVGLGTDSLASNDGLSMLEEMARARRLWPGLAPNAVLEMATAHGGAALGRPSLGRLARGIRADLCVAPLPEARSADAFLEAFTSGGIGSVQAWIGGSPVRTASAWPNIATAVDAPHRCRASST
jgi:cytosine/adenosine deaminase-related metal-dependent hydrolase